MLSAEKLVSRVRNSLTNLFDSSQDQICVGGPHERLGVLVVMGQVLHDRLLQRRDASERPPADPFCCDLGEEPLHLVQPRTARGGEMEMILGVTLEPPFD